MLGCPHGGFGLPLFSPGSIPGLSTSNTLRLDKHRRVFRWSDVVAFNKLLMSVKWEKAPHGYRGPNDRGCNLPAPNANTKTGVEYYRKIVAGLFCQ